MSYPVIDISHDEIIWLRIANEAELKELRASWQRPTIVYWVKDRNGRLLRGIGREGLDRMLGALRWLDDQEAVKLAAEVASLAVLATSKTSFEIFKQEGRRLAYKLATIFENEPYQYTSLYKDALVAHLQSLKPVRVPEEDALGAAVDDDSFDPTV